MATFTASAAQSNQPAVYAVNRNVTRVVRYTHPVALSVGDVIQMVKVPSGAIVTNVAFGFSVSAGVITANIGDGNDTSAYAASTVMSIAAINVVSITTNNRGLGRSYSAEDTIDLQVTVLSAVPGTTDLVFSVTYTNQNGTGG